MVEQHEIAQHAPGGALVPVGQRRPRRWWIIGASCLVVLLAVAAVAVGGSKPQSAGAQVASAASGTLASGSFDYTVTGSLSLLGRDLNIDGHGSADPQDRASQATVSVSSPITSALTADEILVDGTLYLGGDAFKGSLPAGKQWVAISTSGLVGKLGTASGATSASEDPLAVLKALSTAGNGISVTDLGASQLDGAPVERYQVDVTAAALKASVDSSGLDAATKQQIDSAFGQGDVTVYVAIDHQHRVRQVELDGQLDVLGAPVASKMTINLSNWGSSTSISPPPASSTTDLADLSGSPSSLGALANGLAQQLGSGIASKLSSDLSNAVGGVLNRL
jgi:hypothetical protein